MTSVNSSSTNKIIFFINEDKFFYSHFLDRAIFAKNAGFEIAVITGLGDKVESIQSMGIKVIPFCFNRSSINPFQLMFNVFQLSSIYRAEKPKIVHHVALKPILVGELALLMSNVAFSVNAVVGLGYLFISDKFIFKFIRSSLKLMLCFLFKKNKSIVIFENSDDLSHFVEGNIIPLNSVFLIRGAGVSLIKRRGIQKFNIPTIVFGGRLLLDKGIGEFIEAAKCILDQAVECKFIILGDIDAGNRASITMEQLNEWRGIDGIEFLGYRDDIREILSRSNIACLPSYREGLPKFLLEAMAEGLPCVTTNVPGCREAVINDVNGILVPVKDSVALADALIKLLQNPNIAIKMGETGRALISEKFSTDIICSETLLLYKQL